jgi:hypothetical protein
MKQKRHETDNLRLEIAAFNEYLFDDQRLESTFILPLFDGITISIVK